MMSAEEIVDEIIDIIDDKLSELGVEPSDAGYDSLRDLLDEIVQEAYNDGELS